MHSAVPRCSWQYTSVTMISILLRFLLPQRRCVGMWWSCARSQGRRTATCLRCGVDLVRDNASLPSVIHAHTMQNARFPVTYCFVCVICILKGRNLCAHTCRLLLIKAKLLFWSRPYTVIHYVVICLEISFWRVYLGLFLFEPEMQM